MNIDETQHELPAGIDEDLEEPKIDAFADGSEEGDFIDLFGDEAQEELPQGDDLLSGWNQEEDDIGEEGAQLSRENISDRLDEVLKNPDGPTIDKIVGSIEGAGSVVAGQVSIRAGKVKGDNNILAGIVNNNFVSEPDGPFIKPLPPGSISEMRGVFARPEGYEEAIGNLRVRRPCVVAICGPKHCGRFTCAVNVAHDVWGESEKSPEMFRYKRAKDEWTPLSSIIETKQVKKGTILIVEEALESNVARHELEPPDLDELEKALKDKECVLLLTMEAEELRLPSVTGVNAKVGDLWRVLERHLLYLKKQEKWPLGKDLIAEVRSRWSRLERGLRNPSKIDWFCRWLVEQYRREPRDIGEILEDFKVADRRALQEWFGGLSSNEKFLAMLTFLLGGSERQLLEDFYRRSVSGLRSDGLDWLVDPRQLGFEDMVAAIEARDLGGWIEFKDAEFEEEVAAQVGNWTQLLWSVLDPLVKDVGPREEWNSWQPRRALGNALGRMSLYGRKNFSQAVEHLAGTGWAKASVVAGYALEEAARKDFDSQRRPVLEILLFWIDSGDPSWMWAAGASLSQVYAATVDQPESREAVKALQESLFALLRRFILNSATFNKETYNRLKGKAQDQLAKDVTEKGRGTDQDRAVGDLVRQAVWAIGRANRICASKTAQRIFALDPQRSGLLGRWYQSDSEFLREVARESLMLIFGALTRPRYKPGEAKHRPFLGLVEPVLAAAGRGKHDRLLVEQVLLAVKSWLRWPSWYELIFQALLDVANRGSSEVREKLRSALSRLWLHRGSNQEAERTFAIAQAIIARSYAMDGILMDRPRFGRCVFVLDPTFLKGDEESRDRKEKVYRHLLGILETQIDVSVVHLGSRQDVHLEDQCWLPLATAHPVPPLVMPALEAACTADTRLILVLTVRRLWDLEDVTGRPWAKDFFVVASGEEVGGCEGVETIPIGEDPKPEEVEKVEKALRVRWARALAKAGPWDWWHVLQSFGVGEEIGEGPHSWLNCLVDGLGDIGRATGHGDVARQLLCIVGWYASRDLRACAGVLRSWLEEPLENEPMPFRRWMGAAGARALLSMHSAEPPSPEDSAPEILFEELAEPLAFQGRDGSEAVLRAVRQWIEEPFWAEYLAGEVVEGRGRLLRWAERFAPQHAGELRRLLPEPKTPVAPFDDGWESLEAMMERLRRIAALGQPKILPELAQGESYALIVLDGSDKPANFDTIAIHFLRSLHRQNGHGLKPVVYRLGERRPVWVAGVAPERDDLLVPEASTQPRLLGPILMDPKLAPEWVKFVLVLSRQPLLDAEDWLGTEWRDRIVFYRVGADGKNHPGFAAIPALAGKPVGDSIARFLLRNPGVEADPDTAASDEASAA
jgi:hypothetical protein